MVVVLSPLLIAYCVLQFVQIIFFCILSKLNLIVHSYFFMIIQQILFHLSQITPRRHTIRLKESKASRKTSKTARKNDYEQLCQQSLCETLRNSQTTPINAAILDIPLDKFIMSSSHVHKAIAIEHLNRFENRLKTSYVSKNSFAENKAEPILDARQSISNITSHHPSTILLTMNSIRQISHLMLRNSIQIRGFKTQRNIESQLKRNPSFLSRIQQYLGSFFWFILLWFSYCSNRSAC